MYRAKNGSISGLVAEFQFDILHQTPVTLKNKNKNFDIHLHNYRLRLQSSVDGQYKRYANCIPDGVEYILYQSMTRY